MEGLYILVLDRGFVFIADIELSDKVALHWHAKRSRTIRHWGTTDGLAQLKDGPTTNTVLDPVCERTIPFRSILDMIHVTSKEGVKKWEEALGQ